jgi:hypothetical protein
MCFMSRLLYELYVQRLVYLIFISRLVHELYVQRLVYMNLYVQTGAWSLCTKTGVYDFYVRIVV